MQAPAVERRDRGYAQVRSAERSAAPVQITGQSARSARANCWPKRCQIVSCRAPFRRDQAQAPRMPDAYQWPRPFEQEVLAAASHSPHLATCEPGARPCGTRQRSRGRARNRSNAPFQCGAMPLRLTSTSGSSGMVANMGCRQITVCGHKISSCSAMLTDAYLSALLRRCCHFPGAAGAHAQHLLYSDATTTTRRPPAAAAPSPKPPVPAAPGPHGADAHTFCSARSPRARRPSFAASDLSRPGPSARATRASRAAPSRLRISRACRSGEESARLWHDTVPPRRRRSDLVVLLSRRSASGQRALHREIMGTDSKLRAMFSCSLRACCRHADAPKFGASRSSRTLPLALAASHSRCRSSECGERLRRSRSRNPARAALRPTGRLPRLRAQLRSGARPRVAQRSRAIREVPGARDVRLNYARVLVMDNTLPGGAR